MRDTKKRLLNYSKDNDSLYKIALAESKYLAFSIALGLEMTSNLSRSHSKYSMIVSYDDWTYEYTLHLI